MDKQTILLLLRITARVSFGLFLCAFAAPALARLWPGSLTRWLDAKRRAWILAFAASHTFHLALIILLAAKIGPAQFLHNARWPTLVGGAATFALLYALAAAAAFPNRFQPLQSPGFQWRAQFWIGTIFTLAFVSRVPRSPFYWPFALAALAALVLRLIAALRANDSPAAATAES